MPVDTKHTLYDDKIDVWTQMRDNIAGDRQIKAKGTTYTPQLDDQDNAAYKAMIERPSFENMMGRVQSAGNGLIFIKEAETDIPPSMKDYLNNIDMKGSTLKDISKQATSELQIVGREGILVDMSSDTSKKQRSFMSFYYTENIINWNEEVINGVSTITLVVLKESEKVWIDKFEYELQDIYRVLELEDIEKDNVTKKVYKVSIHKQDKDKGFVVDSEMYPLMNSQNIAEIPFFVTSSEKMEIDPQKPPLEDLSDINISYFKLDVELHHALHYVGLPMGYGSGIQLKQDETIKVGSSTFQVFPDPDAKLEYLQLDADGLTSIERKLDSKKEAMVAIGSSILQADKKVAEATDTIAMKSAGEKAVNASIADAVSRQLTKALEFMRDWDGLSGDITYRLNTDFNNTAMSPQLLREIMAGVTMGEIPSDVLIHNMREGELIPDSMTDEEYKTLLEEQTPNLSVSPIKPAPVNNQTDISDIRKKVGL